MRTRLSLHDAAPPPPRLPGGPAPLLARAPFPSRVYSSRLCPSSSFWSLRACLWRPVVGRSRRDHAIRHREAAVAPAGTESTAAGQCLSRHEQRARIAARTVVPLAKATRAVVHGRGDDLLPARLCERDGRLVDLLQSRGGGKVLRAPSTPAPAHSSARSARESSTCVRRCLRARYAGGIGLGRSWHRVPSRVSLPRSAPLMNGTLNFRKAERLRQSFAKLWPASYRTPSIGRRDYHDLVEVISTSEDLGSEGLAEFMSLSLLSPC